MKDVIKTILYEWKERKLPEVYGRKVNLQDYSKIKPRKIIAITGFRRVGKTYLLFGFIKKLLRKYSREEVIYINFEDERIPLKSEFLSLLIPTIKEVFGDKIKFFFLDEIHVIPDWSKWLRRIYDTEEFKIFVTGSSSKVTSREIPTELRGRCIEIKILPLSFKEFLNFKRVKIDFHSIRYSLKEKIKLNKLIDEYLYYGGMPEVVLSPEERKIEILREYYATVLRRDIVERFRIKNEEGLSALLRVLLNSRYFSISKLYNNLKSMNYEIGKGTLQRYISYIESSYFLYPLFIFSSKIKNRLQTARKIYFIDNGFITALSIKFSKNWGRLYENSVFVEFLRRGKEIFYWRDYKGREVDFVVAQNLKSDELIQACYKIDEEVIEREIKALISAGRELKCSNMKIITREDEGEKKIKGKKIKIIPLWKWLII